MSVVTGVTIFQLTTAAAVLGFIVAYYTGSPWRRTLTGKAFMAMAVTVLVLLFNGITKTMIGTYEGMNWVRLCSYISLTAVWSIMLALVIRAQRHR